MRGWCALPAFFAVFLSCGCAQTPNAKPARISVASSAVTSPSAPESGAITSAMTSLPVGFRRRCQKSSRVSKSARPTPFFKPTNNSASGPAWATYHISVLGSPPSCAARSAGGWTCRDKVSWASIILTNSGKRLGRAAPGPKRSAGNFSTNSCKVLPSNAPLAIMFSSPGRSQISQDSPMGFSGGRVLP